MYKEILKCLSRNCRLFVSVMAVTGICVYGPWGCNNSDVQPQHVASCNADQCGQDDSVGNAPSHDDKPAHDDTFGQDDNLETDTTVCSRCKDYEICLEGKCLCEPSCDGKSIKDDGCGGQCTCPEGKVANEQLHCVDPPECSGTCEISGWECGEICGASCGRCAPNHRCVLGYCQCEPECDGTRCDDGCGGSCPCAAGTACHSSGECVPEDECKETCDDVQFACGSVCGEICGGCAETESCINHECDVAVNCLDCSLKLSLLDKRVVDDRIESIILAVDYAPMDNEPKPRMFDVRLKADAGASLTAVTVGDALKKAAKDLYTDPGTHRQWQERADGTYRFVAFSVSDNRDIEKGRLMTLTFSADVDGVAVFSIVEKIQIFAPPLADEALQLSNYAETIKVTR